MVLKFQTFSGFCSKYIGLKIKQYAIRVSPSGGDWGILIPFFYAVFGHFVQIVPQPIDPIWQILLTFSL